MKPTKSSKSARPSAPSKSRSSRLLEGHGSPSSPSTATKMDPGEERADRRMRDTSKDGPGPPRLAEVHSPVTSGLLHDPRGLDGMRKRMSEALAKKQEQRTASKSPPMIENTSDDSTVTSDPVTVYADITPVDEAILSATNTTSTESAKTIRALPDWTPGSVRTPSYPFPRMNMKLRRGLSQRSGPHHKPFTLLSPTNEAPTSTSLQDQDTPVQQPSSEVSTPMGPGQPGDALPEDPNYPTPDLYDMVLMLSTEPGLDSWWGNAIEILLEAYGAERASLALPGDITDLENVPWGQKATFSVFGSDSGGSAAYDSQPPSETDLRSIGREFSTATGGTESTFATRRPPLIMRHSIAGVLPESSTQGPTSRPTGPVRTVSTKSATDKGHIDSHRSNLLPRWTRQSPTPQSEPFVAGSTPIIPQGQGVHGSSISAHRCVVYRALQPLEAEPDALLARTGVSSLFGKRKPVVLTRAYSEDNARTPSHDNVMSESGRLTDLRFTQKERDSSSAIVHAFDEYEQPEPSPWTQSPSPSPAARPDPDESPFFVQPSSTIDEEAFASDPPPYDYGSTANLPPNAIGTDYAKTLVHIPLIQPVPSRNVLASSLRFPIAILSFITPVNPFPRNLRQSLCHLLPHLASTFALAQQYSTLQARIFGGSIRQGAAFGLGGTFSDEGSELELVNELSSQLQQERAISKGSSLAGSFYSASEKAAPSRGSPSGSALGTPHLEQFGLSADFPSTPGRSGTEIVDGYFSAKKNRSGMLQSQKSSQAVPTLKTAEDHHERIKRSEKGQPTTRGSLRKAVGTGSNKTTSESSHRRVDRTSSFHSESSMDPPYETTAERTELSGKRTSHRDSLKTEDGEKPLPELIAALVLNAVPLQLFLAKPSTGDLVWTNRKFDAFRSQGEGRIRDPWKNVHSADRPALVKTWNEALKTGNQFTYYVRVRRFNSDSESDFRWFVFRASTMLSNDGRLLYWIGSFLDVHEQYMKNLEAQEMEANMARDAKLRALADAIPQVLFEALEGEGIVSVNQQWHTYSGQTLEEARGLGFARHVHRDDLHKCGMLSPAETSQAKSDSGSSTSSSSKTAQPTHLHGKSLFAPDDYSLATMIKRGSMMAERDENGRVSYTTEIRLRSKGGEFRWFLVRLVKVQNEAMARGHASWYGTCTDIETRMNLERDLNEANRKVHSEMESKTKFFANMSHEIRTPLNGILGSMPWLVESTLDHDQRRTVDTIQNSANNLRELVDNILDVTKVEAGKMTLLPKWFHVRSLCEEVVDTCSSRAIERGLELNYTLDPAVPATVKGDPFRVRQVLLNLMGNSVKFTEQGEIYLRCTLGSIPGVQTSDTEALLQFDVLDTGRGFNETEFKRLFKQFGQIEGASQHDAGSGLGLFLSKQLVEMHGGELSVHSKTGEGSTFSFYVRVEVTPGGTSAVSPQHPVSLRPGHHHSISFGSASHSRADSRTPTISSSKSVVHTPGLSQYTSPEVQSPSGIPSTLPSPSMASPEGPSEGSDPSMRSNSGNVLTTSSISSNLPTPDSNLENSNPSQANIISSERQAVISHGASSLPLLQRAQSDTSGIRIGADQAHPQTYSIVVICPAVHARTAIKQHIEHVVPHSIPVNVTVLKDIGSFLELWNGPSPPVFTHVVLDVPASSDVMLFMRQIASLNTAVIPALVIVTDHYQKRDIFEDFVTLTTGGCKAFLVHKPVKPSVFAMIFDPAQLRNLSKDRAREVAQSSSDDFKKIANLVKETIGNRSFRLLLVEDSDTNRMVIQRYLRRVGLQSDEARDGQECVDKVRNQPHGYYSLIICDIQMPNKNGYEACTEIRQWERDNTFAPCPIMALTANAMPEERAAASAAGFTDYLTKPVDFNRLGHQMMRLLNPRYPHVLLRDQPVELDKPS